MAGIFGFGNPKKVQQWFRYYFDVRYALSLGAIDIIKHISINDKIIPGTQDINIYGGEFYGEVGSDDLFGVEDREGGFRSKIRCRDGRPSQGIDSYYLNCGAIDPIQFYDRDEDVETISGESQNLADVTNEPAYRNLTTVSFERAYIGNSAQVGNIKFKCSRLFRHVNYSAMWNGHLANIYDDMNPAHIIYECLTQDFGLQFSTSLIDQTSFTATAQTLVNEAFGLSYYWNEATPVGEFINEVLKTIDGYLVFDDYEQKFKLTLLRPNTDTSSFFDISVDNGRFIKIIKRSKTELEDLVTRVEVKYKDIDRDDKSNSISSSDLAMRLRIGRAKNQDMEFMGITKRYLGLRVASRELEKLSKKRETIELECSIECDYLEIGSIFTLNIPQFKYFGKVFRVVSKRKADFLFSKKVVISALEDLWATPQVVESDAGGEAVTPTYDSPSDTIGRVDNINYHQLASAIGDADARLKDGTEVAFIFQSIPVANFYRYRLNLDGNTLRTAYKFSGAILTSNALSKTDTIISFSTAYKSSSIRTNKYYYINEEIVYLKSINYVNLTGIIERGLLDTYPQEHNANSYIWATQSNAVINNQYDLYDDVDVKFLPVSDGEMLDDSLATSYNIELSDRYYLPYPPKNIKINAQDVLTSTIDISLEDIVITFASRNRITETGNVFLNYYDSTTAIEDNTLNKAVLEFFVSGVSQGTMSLTTATDSLTITQNDVGTNIGIGTYDVTAKFSAIRDTFESYQSLTTEFTYTNDSVLDADITIDVFEILDADITIDVTEI